MKILYISEFFFEVNGANKLSMMHYDTIRSISDEELMTIALNGKFVKDNDSYINFQSYSSRLGKLRNFIQLNNSRINNKVIKEIYKIIIKNNIEVVFIDNSTYGRLVKYIKKRNNNIKVITFYHDVKRSLAKKWLKKYGLKNLPDYIVTIYNEYLNVIYADKNITLNKRESELFVKYYNKYPDLELPIYMNESNDIRELCLNKEEFSILFVGAYYYPNVEGIKWFCKNVVPFTSDRCKLYIVGKGMEVLREELQDTKVEVVGEVEDLSYYYNFANVVIAPIFDGGGMKVKTAEAFMFGKNFIGSDESLTGYKDYIEPSLLGKNIHIANSKNEYLDAINYLISSNEKINLKIRDMYKKNYSNESAFNKLKSIIFNYK